MPVGDDLDVPRHTNVDPNFELATLMMVLVGLADRDETARNARMEMFKARNPIADVGDQGIGTGDVANRDLNRDLHGSSRRGCSKQSNRYVTGASSASDLDQSNPVPRAYVDRRQIYGRR